MSHDDNDLSDLLKPLRDSKPTDLQMQKWQSAVRRELNTNRVSTTRSIWALQLAAAMFVGAIVGALFIKLTQPTTGLSPLLAQISSTDATFERTHTNLD